MSQGSFAFVLHSHLPYVLSHGRWPHGTDWLCEAAGETYLPIIRIINELIDEGISPKLTIGISPVLCEQLADNSFKSEFVAYLNQKLDAAKHDSEEFHRYAQKSMLKNSHFWEQWYTDTLKHFNDVGQDILFEFKKLQDKGYLEIITCGATHGYYPLLSRDESLQAQTKAAVKNYKKHFDKQPTGIWLPECAYRPRYKWTPPVPINGFQESYLRKGSDEFLSENGIDYFIIDSVLLKGGKSQGVYIDKYDALKMLWGEFEKGYQPAEENFEKTPRKAYLVSSESEGKKPTAIFSRDPETGVLVWSGDHGYPGDGNYLDFHKKRSPGGHKYWAVTSSKADLADKVEYNRESALNRIPENAEHFVSKVEEIMEDYAKENGEDGILMAPYDAELFGHWWFEGPEFLKATLKRFALSDKVELTFLKDHLTKTKPDQIVSIPEGSWGQGNGHYIWLNKQNDWSWKHIYEVEEKMCRYAKYWFEHKDAQDEELTKLIKQAGRELMLLSASDWQFLISTFAARDYAELRLHEHYDDFNRLSVMIEKKINGEKIGLGEWEFFEDCTIRDALFEEFEIEWFAKVDFPA